MTWINKEDSEEVWKAADAGKSGVEIADLAGISYTSVSRLIRARKGMERGRLDHEIAKKTGWSLRLVAELRQWWIAYEASQNKTQKPSQEREGEPERPEGGPEPSPFAETTDVGERIRVETPGFSYGTPPPLLPGYRTCTWVLNAHLTNPSKTLPVGIRNIRLEVIRDNESHIVPHLGNSTGGFSGEVPFPEAALPVAIRLQPVETLSGKLRFIELNGFAGGRVTLDLLFEEADGQVHRHSVSEFFDLPELAR